jgi:hypothetical protein
MSGFKIFDGTNWVDPCNCNISILDVDGVTYKLINPHNCIVSYFDGTNWCPITCPCECPSGYTFNASTNSCEAVEISPATPSGGTTAPVVAGNTNTGYSEFGARLYENITGSVYPLNGWQNTTICTTCSTGYQVLENAGTGSALAIQQLSAVDSDIFNSQGTTTLGRLNNTGLWATGFPNNQWLNVEFCINIAETKTYIFALAGDNQVKADITSTTFNGGGTFNLVNLWASDSPTGLPASITTMPHKLWHMFPITLPAGSHTLKLSGYNFAADKAFGAEIYDISELDMTGLMTSSTATVGDLQPYILFSTESLITSPPLLIPMPGQTITWSCPSGSTYSLCYGAPSCITVDSIPCGNQQPLTINTEVNIWFDNSGSMNTTRLGLELMQAQELKTALLPIFNYDETLYNKRVKLFDMNGSSWNYNQRFIKCLAEERNFQRTPDTDVNQVINLVFTDRSVIYGYGSTEEFDNTAREEQYDLDVDNLRNVMATAGYDIKGTVFRINSDQNSYVGFRTLVQSTFVNNQAYTKPYNLNDFYSLNFNCNLDTMAADKSSYYKDQVVAALRALDIVVPVV